MSDDSADKRAVGAHQESFSGRAHPRWTSWTQADPDPTCFRSCIVDTQNRRAQWHMLPQSYPNYKSVHRRFQTWCRDEVLRRVLMDVANELRDKGALEGWRGGDWTDEARKRHENHDNRGSSWTAALGQHAYRQSPRSSPGSALL